MNSEQIEQLGYWLAGTDIGLLELRGPNLQLSLRNDGAGAVHHERAPAPSPAPAARPAGIAVKAPSLGLFLHTHPQRLVPFVNPGVRVLAGQAVGLLQIGSLLLPVHAPQAGTVASVHVAHGTPVGYGTPLMDLET